MWPASLSFTQNKKRVVDDSVWQQQASSTRKVEPVAGVDSAIKPADEEAHTHDRSEVESLHRQRPRLRDEELRRAAAATNTSLFVAAAQRRAALRAARRTASKPPQIKKRWDASPLSKLCDRDSARTLAIERRIRAMHKQRNERFSHRHQVTETGSEEKTPNLEAARLAIRFRKLQLASPRDASPRDPFSPTPDQDAQPERISTAPSSLHDPNMAKVAQPAVECVGSPRRSPIRRRRGISYTTRPTSPFDPLVAARMLGAAADPFVSKAVPKPLKYELAIPDQNDIHERRVSLSAIEDVGVMARAVAGLVGSASRAMELHEDRQRREIAKYNQLASFQTWQSRAQQQLDASLRLQQQQLAATLADWRASQTAPPYYQPKPPSFQLKQHQVPHEAHQEAHQQGNYWRGGSSVPFGGATPQLPRDDAELVERIWEKIAEIEDDERAVERCLCAKPRPADPFATVPGPSPPEERTAATIYIPPDGSSVSLPLGIVTSLVENVEPGMMSKQPSETRFLEHHALGDDAWRSKSLELAQLACRDLLLDASVSPNVTRCVLDHRDALKTFRGLVEADLFNSGLTQTQIVDTLADEILEDVLNFVTREVDAIFTDTSETILSTA